MDPFLSDWHYPSTSPPHTRTVILCICLITIIKTKMQNPDMTASAASPTSCTLLAALSPHCSRHCLIINNFVIFCNHTTLMLCFWCLQLGPPHRCPLGPSHHKPCPWRPYCFSPPSQQLQCMNLQCMSATNPHHISPQTSMAHFATNIHSAFRHKHPWRSPQAAHRRQHSFPNHAVDDVPLQTVAPHMASSHCSSANCTCVEVAPAKVLV